MGISSDNATTGLWIIDAPMGSFSTPGDPSTIVQTDQQHTPGGTYCAVTGNATSTSDGMGTNDVDGGVTTLESPVYNLTSYTNPIFTYYRWYINNPPTGANPGNDSWEVAVSNDGTNWIKVERTNVADKSWRRFAFRVKDYVTLTNNFQVRFMASDSLIPGAYLNGGSIVEAAVDDMFMYESMPLGVDEPNAINLLTVYPNPAKNEVNINYEISKNETIQLQVLNNLGQVIYSKTITNSGIGLHTEKINTENFAAGLYQINFKTQKQNHVQKFAVLK